MRKRGFSRPNPGGEPPREARGVRHVLGGFGDWPDVVGLWATGAGPQRAWNVSCVCVARRSVAGTSRVGAAGPLQGAESPRGSGPVRGAEAPVPRGLSVVLNLSGADPGSWEVEPGVRPQRVSRLACPSHPCALGLWPPRKQPHTVQRACLPAERRNLFRAEARAVCDDRCSEPLSTALPRPRLTWPSPRSLLRHPLSALALDASFTLRIASRVGWVPQPIPLTSAPAPTGWTVC